MIPSEEITTAKDREFISSDVIVLGSVTLMPGMPTKLEVSIKKINKRKTQLTSGTISIWRKPASICALLLNFISSTLISISSEIPTASRTSGEEHLNINIQRDSDEPSRRVGVNSISSEIPMSNRTSGENVFIYLRRKPVQNPFALLSPGLL